MDRQNPDLDGQAKSGRGGDRASGAAGGDLLVELEEEILRLSDERCTPPHALDPDLSSMERGLVDLKCDEQGRAAFPTHSCCCGRGGGVQSARGGGGRELSLKPLSPPSVLQS